MKKCLIILALYEDLRSPQGVSMTNFIVRNGISVSSFRRYVSDINCYLSESYSGEEVIYQPEKKRYIITKI